MDTDDLKNLKEEISRNNLKIEIIGFVPKYNLFGHKFLWQIFLGFQNSTEKKELEFFKNKIAKKEFYLKSKI